MKSFYDETASADQAPPLQYKTVSMRELGARLPIGSNGGAIVARNWDFQMEKRLARLRETNKDLSNGHDRFVPQVIAAMCSQFDGVQTYEGNDLQEINKVAQRIASGWFVDLLYAWIWLRKVSISNVVRLTDLRCVKCGLPFPSGLSINLDDMDVRVPVDEASLQWTYTLRRPFMMRGHEVKALTIGQQRWSVLDAAKAGAGDSLAMKLAIVRSSVLGSPDAKDLNQIAVVDSDLAEMSKVDFESIASTLDATALGPQLVVDLQCPDARCMFEFQQALDWRYESFFVISGQ